jgi:hypothetical protein
VVIDLQSWIWLVSTLVAILTCIARRRPAALEPRRHELV